MKAFSVLSILLSLYITLSCSQLLAPNRFQLRLAPGEEPYTTILTYLVEDSWGNGTSPLDNPPPVDLYTPGPNNSTGINQTIVPYAFSRISGAWVYRAKFTNLTNTNIRYTYKVVSTRTGNSTEYSFRPLVPDPIKVGLIFIGSIDTGSTFQIYVPVIINIFGSAYGPGISPGSVAGGTSDAKWNQLGKAIEPFSAIFPLFMAAGPLDFDSSMNASNYENRLSMPAGANKYYFSTDFSGTHFVSISSFTNYTKGSIQYTWLEADLKAANMNRKKFPWIIVSGYSSMYNAIGADYLLMEELEPLFLKYGVDLCVWNGHYFTQSKPMSGRYVADRFVGTGNLTSPYLNTAPIHVLVGTGGLNLAQDCTGLKPSWAVESLCTYGVTNITVVPDGSLYGVFQQLPFLHLFQVRKNLTLGACPFNCQGNGVCDPYSLKCVCNESYYGTDCGIYMQTTLPIPRGSIWEYSSSSDGTLSWTEPDFNVTGTSWLADATPFGFQGVAAPLQQANQFSPVSTVATFTRYFRNQFYLPEHPGENWVLTLSIKYVGKPAAMWVNGVPYAVKVGDEVASFYYGGRITFENQEMINGTTLEMDSINVIAFDYGALPYGYFEATIDLDSRCGDGWTGKFCNITLDPSMDKAYPTQIQIDPVIIASSGEEQKSNATAIALGIVGGLLFLAGLAVVAFFVWRLKFRKPNTEMNDVGMSPYGPVEIGPAKQSDWEVKFEEIEILRKIGEGAFGVVYHAKWRNAACVVKQMKMDVNDQLAIRDFLREANNMKRLRPHPNVTDLLGICTAPDKPICILTEYLSEGSLSEMIAKGNIVINASLAVSIARDVASGMSHLHEEKILHCDLAARNLLVALKGKDQYVVKVADFGLSHIAAESENYNINAETKFPIRWSAPEVMTRHQVSQKSDVWSYGVAIWEIIEQKKPYNDLLSNQEVMVAVCNGTKLPRPTRIEIPDAFWELLMTCFAYEPRDRPLFQSLCKSLTDFTDGAAVKDVKIMASQDEYLKTPGAQTNEYKVTPTQPSEYRNTPATKEAPNEYKNTPYAPISDAIAMGSADSTNSTAYAPIGEASIGESNGTAYAPIGEATSPSSAFDASYASVAETRGNGKDEVDHTSNYSAIRGRED